MFLCPVHALHYLVLLISFFTFFLNLIVGLKAAIQDYCQQCNRTVDLVWTSPTTRSCADCNNVLLDVEKEAGQLQAMEVDGVGQ